MSLSHQLTEYISACFTGIWIESHEHDDALREIAQMCRDQQLLEGLIELTDELADQAHDRHGVDCLLDAGEGPRECEKPGHFCSGVPGVLAHMENGRLAPGAKVERCDLCQRYPSDEAALEKLRELGYSPL